jgi:hypothetical protein
MRRGGQRGEIAVNVERITHVAATPGPFTDIYFGEHQVTVEGTFHQVCNRLNGEAAAAGMAQDPGIPRNWYQQRS